MMKHIPIPTVIKITAATTMLNLLAPHSFANNGNATFHHDIQDFVDAQGTFCWDDGAGGCFQFLDPLPNIIFWNDPDRASVAWVDYAGVASQWLLENGGPDLETSHSGSVKEKVIGGGLTKVDVILHTDNALVWCVEGDPNSEGFDFANTPLIFGSRVDDILAGAAPSLADVTFKISFTRVGDVGDPLPDIFDLLITPEQGDTPNDIEMGFLNADFLAKSKGYLPDGSRADLTIVQTGLRADREYNENSAAADLYPVESIRIKPKRK